MVMVRGPSLVSATFLVICGSPWNGTLLEEVGAEPPRYPPLPDTASAPKSCTSYRVSAVILITPQAAGIFIML